MKRHERRWPRHLLLIWRPSHLFIWVVVGCVLRLALWMQPLHQLANDEIEYVTVARDLLAGRGWVFYEHYHWLRAPLYPLFLAGSIWLSGGDLWRAALPNIVLSVATIPLVALLARELAGHTRASVGPLAAAGTAILWTLATFASLYMAETLFTFLFTSALLLLVRWNRTRNLRTLALAGGACGLAILTRSLPLAFLPVVALWLALPSAYPARSIGEITHTVSRVSLRAPLVFLTCCVVVIVPWTLRNCVAYGRCIPVETGLSYNLWAFNEPREDEATIFRTLESISNPAERADYATAKGMERLREDPAIVWRKLWPNWTYLWRVNPIIEDRFLLRTYYADPPPLVFLAALGCDDVLMALVALAGVVGMSRIANRRVALLCASWLLYGVATTLITHGEGRYRHFFFPVLIPCAALALHAGWRRLRWRDQRDPARSRRALLGTAPVVILLLWTIVQTYPWAWATGGMQRSAWLLVGDVALPSAHFATATWAYRNAVAAQERADAWVRLGDAQRATGDTDAALASYRAANALSPAYIAPALQRGDVLRALGRTVEARAVFDVPYADPQQVVDWAWTDLRPTPTARIEVGDGLDFGYVTGVYPSEQQQDREARWTNGRARVRIAAATGQVRLRLAAPRSDGQQVQVEVCNDQRCTTLMLAATWRTYRVVLPPTPAPTQVIELRSSTFVAADGRILGILIDDIAGE